MVDEKSKWENEDIDEKDQPPTKYDDNSLNDLSSNNVDLMIDKKC